MAETMEIKEGFQKTEAGVIPCDWEIQKLEFVADIIMGQSPKGSSYNRNEKGVALINGPTEFTDRFPVKIQWTSEPTKFCQSGDILLCVRGSSTGRINISNDRYCIDTFWNDTIMKDFLLLWTIIYQSGGLIKRN